MQICCSGAVKIATIILLCVEDEITAIILNSPLLFPINNPNNIFIIQNNITFLLFSLTKKSLFFHYYHLLFSVYFLH
jgi:hypothetical protein